MSFSSGAYFGSHSTVNHGRLSRAARLSLLTWIGPLSRTKMTGFAETPGRGPYSGSRHSSKPMKSVLRFVRLRWTISLPEA